MFCLLTIIQADPYFFNFRIYIHLVIFGNPTLFCTEPNLIKDTWHVTYVDNAYELFSNLANSLKISSHSTALSSPQSFSPIPRTHITTAFTWSLLNDKGEVEKFSGFNAFYGVGSKLSKKNRALVANKIISKFNINTPKSLKLKIVQQVEKYLCDDKLTKSDKVLLRDDIVKNLNSIHCEDFKSSILKYLFRPISEMYIPIPDSKNFHRNNPDFFGKDAAKFKDGTKLAQPKELRSFDLVFEPSGKSIRSYITQDAGKGIESCQKQTFLGEWILKGIFRLKDYEPLTTRKLNEIGINAIKLYRTNKDDAVHIEFLYIDENHK